MDMSNNTKTPSRQGKKSIVAIVDAPKVVLEEDELAGDALLKFYHALGWNGEDSLDPCKIKTTEAVYSQLYDTMLEKCPDTMSVGMAMVNKAPSVDASIPPNKVYLLDGWTIPPTKEREEC